MQKIHSEFEIHESNQRPKETQSARERERDRAPERASARDTELQRDVCTGIDTFSDKENCHLQAARYAPLDFEPPWLRIAQYCARLLVFLRRQHLLIPLALFPSTTTPAYYYVDASNYVPSCKKLLFKTADHWNQVSCHTCQ